MTILRHALEDERHTTVAEGNPPALAGPHDWLIANLRANGLLREAEAVRALIAALAAAAAPQPVAQGGRRDEIIVDLRSAHDRAVAQIERLTTKIAAMSAAAPAGVVGEPVAREALTAAIAEALRGTYHCLRVWSAWSVGTMGEDDFSPVEDSDTPAEIADVVMRLYTAPPARQALTDEQIAAMRQAGYLDADDYPDAWAYERGVRDAERAHGIGGKGGANG